jgi:hypothetical protein
MLYKLLSLFMGKNHGTKLEAEISITLKAVYKLRMNPVVVIAL